MIALVTTTIRVPRVLELYRAIDPDVRFYVMGDVQTPHEEVGRFVAGLGNAVYYSDDDQRRLGYESCPAMGWRVPARRSIGVLEAVRHGADVIVSIDDDNIPMDRRYFADFASVLGQDFVGLRAAHQDGWFDPGSVLEPPVHHRGFPHELWPREERLSFAAASGATVGVAAGLWVGDPDVDATTRIATSPVCVSATKVAESGFVVSAQGYAPFNSQNTAFVRELLPVMVMHGSMGRYDDIWASWVAGRVMRETGHHVHYGPPFVWQERNPHALLGNLRAELTGMAETLDFTRLLDDLCLEGRDTVGLTAALYEGLGGTAWKDSGVVELGRAWVRDAERVLS